MVSFERHKRLDFSLIYIFIYILWLNYVLSPGDWTLADRETGLNLRRLHTCLALIRPLCSPSLSLCQKRRLVVFFMSFESQTAVCAFNCEQTPVFSGSVWRSRNDKASVGDRWLHGPVPVWSALNQTGIKPSKKSLLHKRQLMKASQGRQRSSISPLLFDCRSRGNKNFWPAGKMPTAE